MIDITFAGFNYKSFFSKAINMMKFFAAFFFSFFFITAFAQVDSVHKMPLTDTLRQYKKFKILGFPVISYTPETRTGFGVAGVATFRLGKNVLHTSPSQISIGLGYTQNKQQAYSIPFALFTNNNRYYIYGEADYFKYNFYYYGIGKNEVPKELYDANYPLIKVSALRKWMPHYYAGLRYQYLNYVMEGTKPGGELAQGTIPGSKGSVSTGLGVVQVYDKRDSVLYPRTGFWIELAGMFNMTALGSTNTYAQYSLDVATYHPLGKRLVLANNVFTKMLDGDAPFNQYAFIGGNKKMRGYYEGRYRDKHSLILQTELRALIYKRIGAAIFASAGFLGGDKQYVRFNDAIPAYGAGFRYIINKADHLNLRIDYAFDKRGKGNFYATFGEAF